MLSNNILTPNKSNYQKAKTKVLYILSLFNMKLNMKFCDRKKKLITSSSDLKTKPSLWPHSQLITCSSDCGFCSHWPPSWFGSKARWHWPGWQTVCADARCSAAGRALQSKPGRAAAPAAWPTAAGRLMETPKCVNTESCGYNKDGNNATCNEWRNSFSPPIFFFLKRSSLSASLFS